MGKSKRISKLASLTEGFKRLLDIGTDHGLVIKEAIDTYKVRSAIAADLREKPLQQAKKNLTGYPVEYIQSDGFSHIQDESYDLVLIAGMGVYVIQEILEKAPKRKLTYILQPNDKVEILRNNIMASYRILDEWVIYEDFYYVILVVETGKEVLSDEACFLGPKLMKKKSAIDYYQFRLDAIQTILKEELPENRRKSLMMQASWLADALFELKQI